MNIKTQNMDEYKYTQGVNGKVNNGSLQCPQPAIEKMTSQAITDNKGRGGTTTSGVNSTSCKEYNKYAMCI